MVNCAAINCTVGPVEDVSMFSFPKDAKRRRLWLINIKRDKFLPANAAKLCERHFSSDQFTMDPTTARSCGYSR
ncbi:hypothetical protein KUTeg_021795 [Tegillarca granosa]|uniref:THAP-type domain-containing protein n=1 Tax=Tegillarca granosa TaxID=220873 RepID=A0ABQ9E4D5_TEGGR|nr:hypothetical protein KUTeg_021795 [Tegillarca granosa]